MAAVSGIWNHAAAAAQNPMTTGARPMADGSNNNSNDSNADGATITANDFLTLLVTEMQNQDPTADTDPNEYINQLVEREQPGAAHSDQPDAELGGGHGNRGCDTKRRGFRHVGRCAEHGTGQGGTGRTSASQFGKTCEQTGATSSSSSGNSSGHKAAPPGHSTIKVVRGEEATGSAPATTSHGNQSAPRQNPSALRVSRALDGQRITR